MMKFQTRNTLYTIHRDLGDGAFLISGNEKYCPVPTVVELRAPLEVGQHIAFMIRSDGPHKDKWVITTRVQEILK